jgi:hypothetical protein
MTGGRRGGGFGFVMLVVVMAVVLLLVAKAWKSLGGRVLEANTPEAKEAAAALPAQPPAGTTAPGSTPIQSSLTDARKKTAAHTDQVQDALGD